MDSRPKVFLSHSKKDKKIIEKIANDLRKYKIDCWFDDWEINPGESLRKKIFEDGIPSCDLFFVYLTDNSIDSSWVKRELDASFIEQSRNKGFNIVTFVDKEETRKNVPLDIASLHLAIINDEEYVDGLLKLVSSAYQYKVNSVIHKKDLAYENQILELKNEINNFKFHLQNLNNSNETFDKVQTILDVETANIEGNFESINKLLKILYPSLTSGLTSIGITNILIQKLDLFGFIEDYPERREAVDELITPLVLHSIIDVERQTEQLSTMYYLSEFGVKYVKHMNDNGLW
ncbi:hypothetical protein GCM10008986_16600 [Salinibacillus aidingensis]|uniref:TIR domain-containing protein n=1 Tax=Salinibacillus aidingensis TaxID=237684 RepID=A0ABP3L3L5_9BACI